MSTFSSMMSHTAGFDYLGRPIARDEHQDARKGLLHKVACFARWIIETPKRAQQSAELAAMSDRELADIGMTRENIARVHDQDFAADFAAARNARNSLKWL